MKWRATSAAAARSSDSKIDEKSGIATAESATAGTLVSSVDTLKAAGARSIHAAATHGVLCGPAIERLRAHDDSLADTLDTLTEAYRFDRIHDLLHERKTE